MKILSTLLLLLLSTSTLAITELPFDSEIGIPNIEVNRFEQKVESHLVGGIYSKYFPEANFEISSQLYIQDGTI